MKMADNGDITHHQYSHQHLAVVVVLLDQFRILLRRSATLLHPNVVVITDRDDFVFGDDQGYSNNDSTKRRNNHTDSKMERTKGIMVGDEKVKSDGVDSDSDDDDNDLMRMMMGGSGGDSDDDSETENERNKNYDNSDAFVVDKEGNCTQAVVDEDAVAEEDVATLLKRACSVHAALLHSLPSSLLSASSLMTKNSHNEEVHGDDNDTLLDGKVLTEELVVAVLNKALEGHDGKESVDIKEKIDLVNIIAFFSINNSSQPKNDDGNVSNSSNLFGQSQRRHQASSSSSSSSMNSCWKMEKVHLTSSLFAIQFLICLHDITIRISRKQDEPMTTVLSTTKHQSDCWLREGTMMKIILPLIFGMTMRGGSIEIRSTPFLSNDTLRNAVMDLITVTSHASTTSAPSTTFTTPVTASNSAPSAAVDLCLDILDHAISSTSAPSSFFSPLLRQKIIVVVCQIFIRMHDGVNKKNKNKSGETAASIEDAMHRVVVMILRQVSIDCRSCNNYDDRRLSPESLLRPITGLLLPTLYGCHHDQQQSLQDYHLHKKHPQSIQTNAGDDGMNANEKYKSGAELLWNEILLLLDEEYDELNRPQNWIPMATTALLCILLPTFREMELPSAVVAASGVSNIKYCRPIYQPCIWKLIRNCLGRRGGSNFSAETNTVDGSGVGGRGTSLLSHTSNNNGSDRVAMDQLLRRRSAHALRLMLEHERERLLQCMNGSRTNDRKDKGGRKEQSQRKGGAFTDNDASLLRTVDVWTKYVLCFEMLEMEIELHLVDQVWATVKDITSEVAVAVAVDTGGEVGCNSSDGSILHIPRLIWDDIGSLLSRVLLSDAPTMQKLGLYRFLSGHTGVDVVAVSIVLNTVAASNVTTSGENNGDGPKSKAQHASAPLSVVSVDFVIDVVMRAYDSIVGTKVGININIDERGQQERVSIADLLSVFLSNYTATLVRETASETIGSTRLSEFVNRVLGSDLIQSHKSRSVVLYYRSVAGALDRIASSGNKVLCTDPERLQATIRAMRTVFSSGGAPKSMQQGLKLDLALMLKSSIPWKTVDASIVLKVLALYPPSEELTDDPIESTSSQSRDSLGAWILGLGGGKWANNASPACASAFVLGQLLPFVDAGVVSGICLAERKMGMSICTLCSLSGNGSEFLWPAVSKGLKSVPTSDSATPGFCMASRSMILLEYGCKEGVLSGMGNGDLLLDDAKQYLLPPPPQIEALLGNAVQFILSQLMSMSTNLFQTDGNKTLGGSTRSSASNNASLSITVLIGQLRVLHLSFPSSVSLSRAVNAMLADCVHQLTDIEYDSTSEGSIQVVKLLTLSYAALSCGATFTGDNNLSRFISTCHTILNVELCIPPGINAKQTARSIFQYSKWGCLSLIVSNMMSEIELHDGINAEDVYQSILESARNSVHSTPVIALPPLFECAISAGKHIALFKGRKHSLLSSLQSIIETLFAVLEEDSSSSNWTCMLNETCKLLFRGKLLLEEFNLSYSKDICGPMPIMHAFEKLLRMGGNSKPYIFKTVVSRISVAWLGPDSEPESAMGLCAIPYREHIVGLLVYKECKIDESSAHMGECAKWDALPETTDASSITRAFVLSFLSKLPSPDHMCDVVLKELIHVVVMKLMEISCTAPDRGKAFISGSEVYARMIRSWQALCLLSRFVTEDIASDVATRVYHAMSFTMHGQIRYFVEVFTIQCTRLHPMVFGQKYIQEIGRNDLSLQHISSLMIIGGNLTAGQYSSSFFQSSVDATTRMKEVLCGILPWLSSTQSFSRAIAQLLCHKLIPLVVNVNVDSSANTRTNDPVKDASVLRSIYFFLENNTEMTRLRSKQQLFFDAYDVDNACSFEGILSIPVDEGEEANPTYMVDIIKDCLADIYQEAHEEDAPVWKQMEDLLLEAVDNIANGHDDDGGGGGGGQINDTEELVNFQRKILPIDALDLGIRSYHEQKLFNAAGKKKQCLIVCASLIDKVPNLAGLARTCEIFSAQTLVLPNLLVKKQDDFKSISASANDWIEMEECKEEQLLNWLYMKKCKGYEIVGVEQTSSSTCLTKIKFHEKTVLLLGKEKEGIPIEFLSVVDQCIEIPQLGVIRSLNVHVSGAITIWEYSKQMMEKK